MLARITEWRALEERAAAASAKSLPVFEKRGQLLPRQRVALLLDAGAPWLPLCSLAGYLQDHKDPAKSVPGGGMVAGIGFISGVRCVVVDARLRELEPLAWKFVCGFADDNNLKISGIDPDNMDPVDS